MVYSNENKEPYDHMKDTQDFYRVTEEFKSTMRKDKSVQGNYEVKLVIRVGTTVDNIWYRPVQEDICWILVTDF
jgi:hypothetical protein